MPLNGIDLGDFANITITPSAKTTGAVQGWLSDHGMGWLVADQGGGGGGAVPWYAQKKTLYIGGGVAAGLLVLYLLTRKK